MENENEAKSPASIADFICVGMYDFQLVEDVNIALDALANCEERMRPWIV